MNTKSIPAMIMLLAGGVACIAGFRAHMEMIDFLKMLLLVLVSFYVLGCIAKIVLDKNFAEEKEEETTEGEESQEGEEASEEDGEKTLSGEDEE